MVKIVGESIQRQDVIDKVKGKSLYTDDIPLDDFLWGTQVGSPVVRGILKSIKKDENFDWTDFVFVDYKDIPGKNEVEHISSDMPILVETEIRYFNQPILLIAHKNKEKLHEAVKHIKFEIEELPYITTIDDALSKKEVILNGDNVFKRKKIERGDVNNALKESKYVFEATYYTPHQEQMYIEPNGLISWWEGDKVFIKGSMQCPYYIHTALKVAFNKKDDEVVIIQAEAVGGAFGGKEDYPSVIGSHCALLAKKSGKKVKIIYERSLDMDVTTKRHPSKTVVKMGVDENYKITSLKMDFVLDGGAYETISIVILSRGMLHAFGPYQIDNVLINGSIVITNTAPNGAFRGFGAPQSFFAMESHVDYVATKLGLNPIEFRKINFVKRNGIFPTGQNLRDDVLMGEVFDKMLSNANYEQLKKDIEIFNANNETVKRGFGVASFFHGAGFTGIGEVKLNSKAGLKLTKDGLVYVLVANTEMGQGAHTVLPQIVAQSLNLPMEFVKMEEINTSKVPNSGPTVASRTTMIVGQILKTAAEQLKSKVGFTDEKDFIECVNKYLNEASEECFYETFKKPPHIIWNEAEMKGDAYGTFAWGAYGVYTEVNLLTYQVKLIDFYSVMDIGKVVNPLLAIGQIEGGIVQAIGYGLTEDIVFKNGKFWNNDFTNYIIPSIMDIPKLHVEFLNREYEYGPFGVKGIGELPMDGGAPAINNAIRNAVATDLFKLPLSPEQIMEAIEKE